jgi:hypothetical protein
MGGGSGRHLLHGGRYHHDYDVSSTTRLRSGTDKQQQMGPHYKLPSPHLPLSPARHCRPPPLPFGHDLYSPHFGSNPTPYID